MEIKVRGPKLNAATPLWEATDVEVVEWKKDKGHFHDHRTIRHLFLNREVTDKTTLNKNTDRQKLMLLPGTMVALCQIKKARINLGGESFFWEQDDDKVCQALLLLQAKPESWRQGTSPNQSVEIPDCVCLGGEIDLNLLPGDAARLSQKIERITKIGQTADSQIENAKNLKLVASGLAFEGDCRFEWQQDDQPIGAPFWATPFFSGSETVAPAQSPLYVTLDRELMNSEPDKWEPSQHRIALRFQELAALLRQQFSPTGAAKIYWANLEPTSRSGVPLYHWTVSALENQASLDFERGEWQIVVADQIPGETDVPPRGVLTLSPKLKVKKAADNSIVVSFEEQPETSAKGGKMIIKAVKNAAAAGEWRETIEISDLTTEYESLAAAETLRRQYGLSAPDSADARASQPAILWGFMPLADGWAQMPFLNLSEQHYFDAFRQVDAALATAADRPKPAAPVLVGAALFGNDAPETFLPAAGENAWSVALLNGAGYWGEWVIKPDQSTPPKLELAQRTLEIFSPDIALNGFFHLGTESPGTKDLLPSFDEFLSELKTVALRTARPAEDRFPAPFQLHFERIAFENRLAERDPGTLQEKKFSAPALREWQFAYQINALQIDGQTVFEKLLREGVWRALTARESADRFEQRWRFLPLVWRRHPSAPLIQALPLTQTQTPPSHPSPSRQLAPFEFSVEGNAPGESLAVFGADARTGAKGWARWMATAGRIKPTAEWSRAHFLWLAALGFPGLVFDPNGARDLFETEDDFLAPRLLYGLPYTDEINALAQLPKDEPNAQLVSPTQDAPPAKPARAPRREMFGSHWKTLAEKAALAKPDADEMLRARAGKIVVQNLIEPFEWTVRSELDLTEYPGTVRLIDDHDNENFIELTGDLPEISTPESKKVSALKGISGKFELVDRRLRLTDSATDAFEIIAGTMSAHSDGARLRDQRGLWRGATLSSPEGQAARLLKTPLTRQSAGGDDSFTLFTLLEPLELRIEGARAWHFWFRDLPVFTDHHFSRRKTRKIVAQNPGDQTAMDVNDPAAVSSEFNALAAYEWRLAEQTANPANPFLDLLGFRFFPLTLEKIVFGDADRAESIEIIGRLELPIGTGAEKPEAGNVVRVIFKRAGEALRLESITSNLDDPSAPATGGIWTLNPETEFFPSRLHWTTFDYAAADGRIRLAGSVEFYLFDARWFEPLTIQPFAPGSPEILMTFTATQENRDIRLAEIELKFVRTLKPKELKVKIEFGWGGATMLPAGAIAEYDLLKADRAENPDKFVALDFFWKLGTGADSKRIFLKTGTEGSSLAAGALQIEFSGFREGAENPAELQLLPAMKLDEKEPCAGFAVASFEIVKKGQNSSDFRMKYGGLEAVFGCRWGAPLPPDGEARDLNRIFGSSAGVLSAGYTLSLDKNRLWQPSLLLNGMVEVKNLISYPLPPVAALPAEARRPILFAMGSDNLDAAAKQQVKILFDYLYPKPDLFLSLEGHADSVSEPGLNLGKSEARAKAVRQEILRLARAEMNGSGMSAAEIERNLESLEKRIGAVGFGETMPRETNDPETGNKNNRRVEVHLAMGFLPPVRPGGAQGAPLDHVRHTLRVLLNQHEVPAKALGRGTQTLFFNFGERAAWQFLAVVEHRLSDVVFGATTVEPRLANDRRWTAVQEVRFASAKKFSDYLTEFFHPSGGSFDRARIRTTFPAHKQMEPEELSRVSAAFLYKPFLRRLLKETGGKNEITKMGDALLVEASAVQQIFTRPTDSADFTNLQYLPRGVQRAIVSIPQDFALPATQENQPPGNWSLFSLPFLGRLQSAENDFLHAEIPAQISTLAVDPIWYLYQKRKAADALNLIPLAFASRGDKEKIELKISHFDLTRFRRFKRLDQTMLLENWFRLQHPPNEESRPGDAEKLISVTAALPADSSARASRQKTLQRLFDERRTKFPPTLEELQGGDSPGDVEQKLQWRRDSLLTLNGFSDLVKRELEDDNSDSVLNRPYSFYFTAAQINSSELTAPPESGTARFPAVTLLPANLQVGAKANDLPLNFAVSPYLGFDLDNFAEDGSEIFPSLVFADLLCLDDTGSKPVSIASRIWLREEMSADIDKQLKKWGEEIKNRLAADSLLAVLRIRKAFAARISDNSPAMKIAYQFLAISPPRISTIVVVAGSSPLRQPPEKLRFAEGQFGSGKMPDGFDSFEAAPPQVRGTQPVYFEPEVWNEVIKSLAEKTAPWNWGFSALRLSVRFTDQKTGIVGATDHERERRLWWIAFQHQVQFAQPPQIGKLLPEKFRARQIKNLLPVVTRLPMPQDLGRVFEEFGEADERFKYWQPVLPGALNYLLIGARAGVQFTFRHLLLTQKLNAAGLDDNGGIAALAASGVPVQHRFPRPVALPKNPAVPDDPAPTGALQTWASYFDPQKTVLVLESPHNNAFVVKGENEAHRLQMTLKTPSGGIISSNGGGRLCLEVASQSNRTVLTDWQYGAALTAGNRKLLLTQTPPDPESENCILFEPAGGVEKMREFLGGLTHGAELKLTVTVTPPAVLIDNISNYSQTLVFPLRLAEENKLRKPLRYQFAEFEDPEYNRQLVSQAAQASRIITFRQGDLEKSVEMTLAADRREYNASGNLLLAYFNNLQPTGKVSIKRVDSDGLISTLSEAESFESEPGAAAFKVFSLGELQQRADLRLAPGDSLLISLQPDMIPGQAQASDPLELRVEIVARPVTPVPTSGYALLRREKNQKAVECVRFAWSPPPARLELLNPADLKSGVVRRRAVFHWLDTTRFSVDFEYGIQKISSSGSSHFDIFK